MDVPLPPASSLGPSPSGRYTPLALPGAGVMNQPSPPNPGAEKPASNGVVDPKWKIQSVRWDDNLVNRLLSSIRANPDWASSIARGALTSIDPHSSASTLAGRAAKAPLSKTDAIREVTRALFAGDPEYDLDDPAVQRSLLVSVRNKLYKLQPLDELLLGPDGKYSSVAVAARKEALEAEADGPSVRRSLRIPLPKKYAEDPNASDTPSSRASPRPIAGRPTRSSLKTGGIYPRHAPPSPTAFRRPWRPPLPLRPQFVNPAPRSPSAPLRTASDIRRQWFENEHAYLSASLDRLSREAAEREKLDDEHLRLLRLEIDNRERARRENKERFELKRERLREKMANAEEEIRANSPGVKGQVQVQGAIAVPLPVVLPGKDAVGATGARPTSAGAGAGVGGGGGAGSMMAIDGPAQAAAPAVQIAGPMTNGNGEASSQALQQQQMSTAAIIPL